MSAVSASNARAIAVFWEATESGPATPETSPGLTPLVSATEPTRMIIAYSSPSPSRRLAVYRKSDFRCVECRKRFDPPEGYTGRYTLNDAGYTDAKGKPRVSSLDVDHIHPRRHGGTNDLSNLQALCTQCNARKGAKT